jgi:hypothetical protein
MVSLVLASAAALFLVLAALLVGVGVEAMVGRTDGGMVGGFATVVVATLPVYVGYLLIRSARRIRSVLHGSAGRMKQRQWLKFCTPYVGFLIVGDLFVPFPSVLKVAIAIASVTVGVLLLAFELEPSKRKRAG